MAVLEIVAQIGVLDWDRFNQEDAGWPCSVHGYIVIQSQNQDQMSEKQNFQTRNPTSRYESQKKSQKVIILLVFS